MLTAADVAKVYRAGTWKLSKEGPGDGSEGFYHDFTCQQAILGSLRSQQSRYRHFSLARGEEADASQWVAAFRSQVKANAAFAKVTGWVRGCSPDENRPNISISGVRRVAAVTAGGGRGDAWVYNGEDLEGPEGRHWVEFVGVGLRGNVLTVTTLGAPSPVDRHGTQPSESMIRAALQRLAG